MAESQGDPFYEPNLSPSLPLPMRLLHSPDDKELGMSQKSLAAVWWLVIALALIAGLPPGSRVTLSASVGD